MSFASRLVALVSGAVITSTLLASGLSSWFFYRKQVEEIERDGLTIASLLARAAAVADQTPGEVEDIISQHMVVAATAISELVAVAEKCGLTTKQINDRLTRIDDKTILDEVWVTDGKGFSKLHTGHSPDFQFKPSAAEQPQAHEFWDLLTGAKSVVIQSVQKREVDDQKFKYVGVAGVDRPRIVEVGYKAAYFDQLKDKIGRAARRRQPARGRRRRRHLHLRQRIATDRRSESGIQSPRPDSSPTPRWRRSRK